MVTVLGTGFKWGGKKFCGFWHIWAVDRVVALSNGERGRTRPSTPLDKAEGIISRGVAE